MLKVHRFSFATSFTTSVVAIALVTQFTAQFIVSDPSYAKQGKTIQLNGQPWRGQWLKTDDSIYLQDDWMSGAFGIELMDSDRPEKQKLRWFSAPFFAPVTYDRPVQRRYLNIKDIGKEWRTEIVGEILRISTPDAEISEIRRSKQSGGQTTGDRIVVNLDRPTPWQMQRQENMISLTLSADLAPSLVKAISSKAFNKVRGNLIKTFEVQNQGKQTVIKIQTTEPITPEIQTLDSPNRLIVDLKPNYLPPDLSIAWAKGLIYKQQTVVLKATGTNKSLRFAVSSLIVNLKEPSISMRPIWSNPDSMVGTSSLRAIAEQWQAAGAINAGFFNRDRKMPVGAIRDGKRWMAGGVLNRGTVAWNPEGNIFMDRLSFSEEIVTSQGNIALTHLNSGFVQNGLARYTPNWGATYTPLTDNEAIILVQGDRIISQIKTQAATEGKIPIPDNGYLLVARQVPEVLAKLTVGEQIKGITTLKPEIFSDFSNVLGAGPLLLKNGAIVLNAALERFLPPFDIRGASRSAIATTQESGQVLLSTIRATPEGVLPSLRQTAEILKKMGALNALNLDGGSSTTLYLGGSILNRPLGNAAPIHNALGIFINLGINPAKK
jgi:exopolysaccharide biosynthesis protein